MFGNLFNQKKPEENVASVPVNQAAPQVPVPPQNIVAQTPIVPGGVFSQPPVAQNTTLPPVFAESVSSNVLESKMDPAMRQNLTALSRLDSRATQVLQHAQAESKRIQQATIEPEQILFGLLYDGEIFKLLEGFEVDVAKLLKELQVKEVAGNFTGEPNLSKKSQELFEEAYATSKNRSASFIAPEDILLAIFSAASASAFLQSEGIKKEGIEEKLSKSGEYTLGKKSILEKFGRDLTAEAAAGTLDPLTGRDRETERLIHILLRRTKNNPIIIGEAGVGKTAIVEALAQKIVAKEVPPDLQNKRIIQLEVSSLVAGASHRGEFEERLRTVIKEVQASGGAIMLFIDEIHTVIGAGESGGALDASNIIKPFLARGQLQLIGTTTTIEYRKYFEKDKAFERRFQPIIIEEPSEDVAIQMMEILKPKFEKFHKVTISKEAIEASVKLSKKYIGERFLPDKAVDLLDEAGAEVKLLFAEKKRPDNVVVKTDIEKIVASWTGIPITKLTEDESEKLLHLEDLIHKRLIDQEEAVVAVAEAVRRGRIGLASGSRPIASFMFLGPTGTGKTELAKTLAEILFGLDDAMIRLDMSEYMEKHEVAKLIGAPPGYVGYEEGGQLTEAVRAKPYSIVLLDEVEKAHPDVFNILLQVLEDGRLTDNKGNTISFKNTVIIATSNIGSALIQQQLSIQGQVTPEEFTKKFTDISKMVSEELHKFFRPELLNRFDEIVIFKPLSIKDMAYIAKIGIGKTRKLLLEQGFDVDITQNALDVLANEGYDPLYGARPLRRLVQTSIENPVALKIIGKQFNPGDKIMIDYDNQKKQFIFLKAQPVPANPPAQTSGVAAPAPIAPPNTVPNAQGVAAAVPAASLVAQAIPQPNPPLASGVAQGDSAAA